MRPTCLFLSQCTAATAYGFHELGCVQAGEQLCVPHPRSPCLLMQDTEFASNAAKRYAALRAGPWTDAAVNGIISSVNTQIHFAGIRMMDRYPNLLVATLGAPNSQAAYNEVFSQLQSWLLTRLQWLDTAFPAFPTVPGATAPTNVSPSPALATAGK